MLKFSDVKTYVTDGLTAKGYTTAVKPFPLIDPGPITIERLQKKSPNAMLFLTVGNGVGTTSEALFDRPFITVRAIGLRGDYEYAETLAHDLDALLLDAVNGVRIGTARTLSVARTGGSPQLVEFDSGERYHFQATYIVEVKR